MALPTLHGVNKRINVEGGDDTQAVIDRAVPGATLVLHGEHPGQLYVDRSQITLENGGHAVLEKVRVRGVVGEVHGRGLHFQRDTLVDSNSHYAVYFESTSDSQWEDISVTGHGYNDAVRTQNTARSENIQIRRWHVWEVENRFAFMIGKGHTIEGCKTHNLRRLVDQSFNDVDVINFHGPDFKIIDNEAWDIDIAESISTDNTGSAPPPHSDFIQTFAIEDKVGGGSYWQNTGALIKGNKCRGLVGQGLILESNRFNTYSNVRNMTVCNNFFAVRNSYQVVNFRGVDGIDFYDNVLVMDDITGGRFVWFVGGSQGGYQINSNVRLYNNLAIGGGIVPGNGDTAYWIQEGENPSLDPRLGWTGQHGPYPQEWGNIRIPGPTTNTHWLNSGVSG